MSEPPESAAPAAQRRTLAEANALGRQLEAAGRTADAIAAYRAALAHDASYVPAASNLARLLVAAERPREAVTLLEPVCAAAPFDAALAVNYANALVGVGRALEAEQRLGTVIAAGAHLAPASNSLGTALYVQRRFAEAADAFAAAVAAQPDFAEAHENRAQALLQIGRFAEGWLEYEWRWRNPSNALTKRAFDGPAWDGGPLAGRTLLLHAEQGLGDTLQFVRYAALVPKNGGRIVLACQEALALLLGSVAGVDEVRVLGESLPPFDCHAPLLSLPRLFGTTSQSIPDPSPYVTAAPDSEIARESGFKVGVAWSGRARHIEDPHRNRSAPAAAFAPLAALPGVRLYSLQTGADSAAAASIPAVDLAPRIGDFADTAQLVAALDAVVSIDTAVVHLAGALRKPTWVLAPYTADWRWTPARDGTCRWYRSVRPIRQSKPGDWEGVFSRLEAALGAEISRVHK